MSGLSVGGTVIPIAAPGVKRTRLDAVDRSRAFDNTYRMSATGGASRDFMFSTPLVTRALADTYEIVLANINPQTCTGDIISLPTMCCAEITGWTPVVTAQGHSVVIDFVLHEVQPKRLLLKYSPGDTITGESYSRSTTAYQINASGVPVSIAINAKRDGHYIGGVRSILLEDAATNAVLRGNDFTNAAWTKSTLTATTTTADPAGGTTACTLTATGASAQAFQILATGSSIVRTNSCWIRRRTGTGVVSLCDPTDVPHVVALTSTWTRFTAVGPASINRIFDIVIATNGDAIDVWVPQQDDHAFATSEIPTTTVAVTRAADSYSLPFTTPPQEMTVYAKFVEGGTLSASKYVYAITAATELAPESAIFVAGGFYQAYHNNAVVVVTSPLAAAPASGNTVELVARLFGDGGDDILQSINSAASTAGTQSAAAALATAWGGQLLWLNSATATTGTGFTAIQSLKIVAGARSLAEMRSL